MSDSVVKIRIDSKEYDANIKRAGQALSDYMQKVREGGGTMKYLDEGVMEAVQALGQLGTKADNTRAGLREMTQTIADLTVQYRALSDEDKGSEFGREMSKALQQLTERAGAMRDAMADTTAAINNAASDTRRFDQLAQGASLVTAGFQGLQGAAKMLGIEMGDNVEVIAKLQAAMAVTNSLTTIQTALQKQSALMQGVMAVQAKAAAVAVELQGNSTKAATVAQAAFNAVAKANPYVLLASAVAAVGLALVGFSKNAKQATEATNTQTDAMKQAQRMADIWKNTMSSTFAQLMTKYDELKRQWMALKDEHSRTEWIKNNKTALQQLGGAVTDVKTAEDFFNNNTDAVVQSFVRRAQAAARVAQLTELYRKQIELLDKKSQTSAAIGEDAARSGRSARAGDEIKDQSFRNSRYGSVNSAGKWVFSDAGAKLYSGTDTSKAAAVVKIDAELEANQQQIDKVKSQITNEFSDLTIGGGGTGGGGKGGTGTTPAQQAANSITAAEQEYSRALEKAALEVQGGTITEAQQKQKQLQATEALWTAYGKASDTVGGTNADYKAKQAELGQRIVELGGEVKVATEAQKLLDEQARKNAAAWKKLEESSIALYQAQNSNDLKAFYKARDQYKAAGGENDIQPVAAQVKSVTATVTIEADTSDALKKLQEVEGVTFDPKTMTVRADSEEALRKFQEVNNVKLDPKTVKVEYQDGGFTATQGNVEAFIGNLKEKISQSEVGTDLYNSLTAQLADASMLSNMIQLAMKNGVDMSQFDPKTLWTKIFGENPGDYIDDAKWEEIRLKLEEIIGKPITIDVNTGALTVANKAAKDSQKEFQAAASAIQQAGSAMQSIEDPSAKVMGIVAQAIGSIALGFAQASAQEGKGGIWYWIAATAAGLATMESTISAIHSATGYAQGGIVKGNSYSGDNIGGLVDGSQFVGLNAGEVVLNAAQTNGLAMALEGGGMRGIYLSAKVNGEQIVLVANRYYKRTGQGEIVTWK